MATNPQAVPRQYSTRYLERTRDLDLFCAAHNRLPSQVADDQEERRLYHWMSAQRKSGRISSKLQQLLRDFAFDRAPHNPSARLRELEKFQRTHGRPPSAVGDTTKERRLYYWMANRRRLGPSVSEQPPSARKAAPNHAPHNPLARLPELEKFCATHGRLPSQTGDTIAERRLYHWMSHNRFIKTPMPRLYELYEQYRRPRGRPRGTRMAGAA